MFRSLTPTPSHRVVQTISLVVVALLVTACSDPTAVVPRSVSSRPSLSTTTSPDVYGYVTEVHGTVAVIRASDDVTVANIAVNGTPETVAFTPDAAYAYIPVVKAGGAGVV